MIPFVHVVHVLLLVNVFAQISSKPLSTSNAQKSLVNFLKEGINYQLSPCDDFYDYVCSVNRSSSSSLARLYDEFLPKLVEAIRSDEQYPDISESYLTHAEKCVDFQTNDSLKFNAIHKYLKRFGFLPFLQEEPNNKATYMEALLRLILLSPAIFPAPGVYSPIEIEYDFHSINNTFMLYANPGWSFNVLPAEDAMTEDTTFGGYFEKAWTLYQNFLLKYEYFPGYINTTAERDGVVDFVNEFLVLIAKSGNESMTTKKLHSIKNVNLQKAINKLLPQHMDETVNMGNLNVSLDEQLFEELDSLFESKPQQGQHFILSMALLSIAYSTGPALENERKVTNANVFCYVAYALNPRKSGAIFNLYAADLMIRNNFTMTSIQDQLQVRSLVENLQAIISRSLTSTIFLKDNRELIAALNLLSGITEYIGLPEDVYERANFDTELALFSGFYPEDDFIDEVIKLRSSNFRLRNRLLSSDRTYFTFNAHFDSLKNSLYVDFLTLQAPFFDPSYPSSYLMGAIGTIIGHELFHRFAPPHHPESWLLENEFEKSLNCYKTFFAEKMCYDIDLKSSEDDEPLTRICAAGFKDPHQENIPDVEGARVAFQALKDVYGAKLKTKAIPELIKFTHEQLFFVAYAERYCDKRMNDDTKFYMQLINPDPHGANRVRVNAVAMQMSEFATAFNCKASDSMVLPEEDRCYMLPTNQ